MRPRSPLVPTKILVIEDDPSLRGLLAHFLEEASFDVTQVSSGSTALRLLERQFCGQVGPPCELVVSDVRVPGPTGLELLEAIRRQDWKLPVVLITAFGSHELHEEASRLGAAAVLDKPFDIEDLIQKVQEFAPPAPSLLSAS